VFDAPGRPTDSLLTMRGPFCEAAISIPTPTTKSRRTGIRNCGEGLFIKDESSSLSHHRARYVPHRRRFQQTITLPKPVDQPVGLLRPTRPCRFYGGSRSCMWSRYGMRRKLLVQHRAHPSSCSQILKLLWFQRSPWMFIH
jgi:hypothetical protein